MMSFGVTLLVLRILITLSLYAFLGAIFYLLWRDVASARQDNTAKQAAARLVIVGAMDNLPLEVGRQVTFQAKATIGRSPTSTVVIPDSFASTEHARIVRRGGQWWLEDLGSRNGTSLNDMPVDGAVVLSSHDIIGIGRIKLRFETG